MSSQGPTWQNVSPRAKQKTTSCPKLTCWQLDCKTTFRFQCYRKWKMFSPKTTCLKMKGMTPCGFQCLSWKWRARLFANFNGCIVEFFLFWILSSRPILIANVSVFIEIGKLSCSLFSLKSVNCFAHWNRQIALTLPCFVNCCWCFSRNSGKA